MNREAPSSFIRRARGAAGAVALVALVLVAMPSAPASAGYSGGSTETVAAQDDFFDAEAVHVPVGTTVEWENTGRNFHTVTADDGSADDGSTDSGNLRPGQTFSIAFDRSQVFSYFCRLHGSVGLGMAGIIVVGDATIPSPSGAQVGAGREPVPTGPSEQHFVPQQFTTIQEAVDASDPGDTVVVSPGVYHEAVKVTTPYLTIVGTDRNRVILDGEFGRANGIHVIEADGVSVWNMTARHYLLNGFYWTTVNGYRASFVTAYNNGDYGVYAFDSQYGRFEHSYASGHPDSGFYIGQCQPCHAVIDDVIAENNGIGYSGTNAGGDLRIVNSIWRRNQGGIVPNTLDSERLAPQRGVFIAGNLVYDNNNELAPAKKEQAAAFGTGILLAGGNDNVVRRNVVWNHENYGIAVFPNIDENFWIATGNAIQANAVRGSGRADLLLSGPAGDGNCFSGNDFDSSLPPAIQTLHGCGFNLSRLGGGDLSGAIQTLGLFIRAESGKWPQGDWRTAPRPPTQRTLPGCSPELFCPRLFEGGPRGAIPGPVWAIPGMSLPGVSRVASVTLPSDRPFRRQEVTVLGVSIAAPTWWSLLLATYAYLLPLILYVAWVSIALWDLIRQESVTNRRRIGWMAVVLLVPLLGPILYFLVGRSPIPRSLRAMLVAGGLGIYVIIAVLAIVVGGS